MTVIVTDFLENSKSRKSRDFWCKSKIGLNTQAGDHQINSKDIYIQTLFL